LLATATVRETIEFAAKCSLCASKKDTKNCINEVIEKLNLAAIQDRRIGSAHQQNRGLSGGTLDCANIHDQNMAYSLFKVKNAVFYWQWNLFVHPRFYFLMRLQVVWIVRTH
jgi:hypothetical protein